MKSLDEFLPVYEFSTRHEVAVAGDPVRADRALREVTFGEVPLVRALLFARGLGVCEGRRRVVATMVPRATVVEDVPGEGIVLTLSGQFWRLRGRGPRRRPRRWSTFAPRRALLATETRVHVPDPVSRRKFVRYWRVVKPFSGLIRSQVLRAAKRRAEAA